MVRARAGGGALEAKALRRGEVVGCAVAVGIARRLGRRLGAVVGRPRVDAIQALEAEARARVCRVGRSRTNGEQAQERNCRARARQARHSTRHVVKRALVAHRYKYQLA